MESRRTSAILTKDFRAALRGWIVGTAGEITLLESDVVQHPLDYGDVFRLATMRCARHRELFVAPAQRIESAGAEKWNYLKRFGAGPPVCEDVGIASGAEQLIAFSHHGGVHTVLGFGTLAASHGDIELVFLHCFKATTRLTAGTRSVAIPNKPHRDALEKLNLKHLLCVPSRIAAHIN